ncbi:rod shape-determining protein MreD [Acidithiobacillus sp.]|jgi:rod shape-determining protein MreD|uniref:rod shape-determining protein MreD n=1 Tax=Acidithiobacillus sp. TaxID=1872118 RepID=UPI0025C017FC|nr:rod shape-determining protein MreD [Acidithiobacillus sp.]MCK9189840.1 rod shape-determining protein MreD [Acidithiobacillus sp.]MCK9359170.1 rod shape-determining protein MreD [Acidithiobacillus sp.]
MIAIALILGFLFALTAETIPCGPLYALLHPDFVALLLLYWAISSRSELSFTIVWLIGLLQDMVLGGTLGTQAIAGVVMIYLLYTGIARVRSLASWEQLFFIFLLLLTHRLLVWLWQAWAGTITWHFSLLLGPVIGALLWPLFTLTLDYLRHALRLKHI